MNKGSCSYDSKGNERWTGTMYFYDGNGGRTETELIEAEIFISYHPNGQTADQFFRNKDDEFISGTEYDSQGRKIYQGKLHHYSI